MSQPLDAIQKVGAVHWTPWASVTAISLAAIVAGAYRQPNACNCHDVTKTGCECKVIPSVPATPAEPKTGAAPK